MSKMSERSKVVAAKENHRKTIGFLMVFFLLVFLSACDDELAEMEDSKSLQILTEQQLELIRSTNRLSLQVLQTKYKQNRHGNFIFSPISTGMALGMIYNGVGEDEQFEIKQLTGVESLPPKEINKSFNEFISFLQISCEPSSFFCANSMWFANSGQIDENYRTQLMAYYDAEIRAINFARKSALGTINNWADLRSMGRCPQLTSLVPLPDYDIYFVNALEVNAAWQEGKYFRSQTGFTACDGSVATIEAINLEQVHALTTSTGRFDYMEIPLEGESFSLSIVRPTHGSGLDEVLNGFSLNEVSRLSPGMVVVEINITLPEIALFGENRLRSTLGQLGFNSLFEPSLDLSASFEEGNRQISEINQVAKLTIKSDPKPLENRSFSNQLIPTIRVNRPFLFFVKDKHTHTILFAGFYNKPS
jgi:serine protease inhibitor